MAYGMSLHVGLNAVDPGHYVGWDGALDACESDASDMKSIAVSQDFEPRVLLTAEATADAVIEAIELAAMRRESGDHFVLSYSGHGAAVPDRNGEEEADRSDETWVLYDRQLVDDELYALWAQFKPGVRILVVCDSSRSALVSRAIDNRDVADPVITADQVPRYRGMPRLEMVETYRSHADLYDSIQSRVPSLHTTELAASILFFSACQEGQLARDGFEN